MKAKRTHLRTRKKRSSSVVESIERNAVIPIQCPQCGIPQAQWLNPCKNAQGENYCCEGCAEETGCICQNQVG